MISYGLLSILGLNKHGYIRASRDPEEKDGPYSVTFDHDYQWYAFASEIARCLHKTGKFSVNDFRHLIGEKHLGNVGREYGWKEIILTPPEDKDGKLYFELPTPERLR